MSDMATKRFGLNELALQVGGVVCGAADDVEISGVNTLEVAGPSELTFITNGSYAKRWSSSKAGAAVATQGLESRLFAAAAKPLVIVKDAELAMIRLLQVFADPEPAPDVGVHPTAVVHPSVKVGQMVRIGPLVTVDQNSQIGDGVVLHAGVRIYGNVTIGAGTVLHSNVVVRSNCTIGRAGIIHQNVSIGADGFGYRPDPDKPGLLKIPHIGNVIIEDGVEIGANTCIDRAKFGSTVIGAGTKIDNLCQIGHNCRIGRLTVIAGQVGLAGSVVIGDGVQIGGQAGVAEHLTVGHGARIGGRSGVIGNVPDGATWLGYPAAHAFSVLREWSAVRKLPALLQKLQGNS